MRPTLLQPFHLSFCTYARLFSPKGHFSLSHSLHISPLFSLSTFHHFQRNSSSKSTNLEWELIFNLKIKVVDLEDGYIPTVSKFHFSYISWVFRSPLPPWGRGFLLSLICFYAFLYISLQYIVVYHARVRFNCMSLCHLPSMTTW